jgi:uncharacterized protein (TIGR04255 family)
MRGQNGPPSGAILTVTVDGNILSKTALPEYTDPPVVEVVLSVQFELLKNLRTPQMGQLWTSFRDRFPKTEEQPPLDPAIEQFGVRGRPKPTLRVQMLDVPPTPRLWFLNESGTELIQVQRDRFSHNWRKVAEHDEYPRYRHVRGTFQRELDVFRDFLNREKLGRLLPNQCEVTYVNAIVSGRGWTRHGELHNILAAFSHRPVDGFLPEPENVNVGIRYTIPDDQGNPAGRLHIAIDPVYGDTDGVPMFLMKLTARGAPHGDGVEGIMTFLDIGHEWIVRGFTSITTPDMHAIWGRRV